VQPFDALTEDVENLSKSVCVFSPFVSSLCDTALRLSVAKICGMSSINSCKLHSVEFKIVSKEFCSKKNLKSQTKINMYNNKRYNNANKIRTKSSCSFSKLNSSIYAFSRYRGRIKTISQ